MAQPGWMKTQQVPRKLLQPAAIRSSYQADLGIAGADPAKRSFMAKTGMATTTGDLNLGTTKDTYQIPGYAGYIPNVRQRVFVPSFPCMMSSALHAVVRIRQRLIPRQLGRVTVTKRGRREKIFACTSATTCRATQGMRPLTARMTTVRGSAGLTEGPPPAQQPWAYRYKLRKAYPYM